MDIIANVASMLPLEIQTALLTAFMAMIFALSMWYKTGEGFAKLKFFTTVILAGMVGFLCSYWGVTEEFLVNSGLYLVISLVIENLLKIIWRRVLTEEIRCWILDFLNSIRRL